MNISLFSTPFDLFNMTCVPHWNVFIGCSYTPASSQRNHLVWKRYIEVNIWEYCFPLVWWWCGASAVCFIEKGAWSHVYCRSVPESHRASHSVTDIVVDRFSVNHELPAFLFNVLIILLISLLLYFINSVVSFTLHDHDILCTHNLFIYLLY